MTQGFGDLFRGKEYREESERQEQHAYHSDYHRRMHPGALSGSTRPSFGGTFGSSGGGGGLGGATPVEIKQSAPLKLDDSFEIALRRSLDSQADKILRGMKEIEGSNKQGVIGQAIGSAVGTGFGRLGMVAGHGVAGKFESGDWSLKATFDSIKSWFTSKSAAPAAPGPSSPAASPVAPAPNNAGVGGTPASYRGAPGIGPELGGMSGSRYDPSMGARGMGGPVGPAGGFFGRERGNFTPSGRTRHGSILGRKRGDPDDFDLATGPLGPAAAGEENQSVEVTGREEVTSIARRKGTGSKVYDGLLPLDLMDHIGEAVKGVKGGLGGFAKSAMGFLGGTGSSIGTAASSMASSGLGIAGLAAVGTAGLAGTAYLGYKAQQVIGGAVNLAGQTIIGGQDEQGRASSGAFGLMAKGANLFSSGLVGDEVGSMMGSFQRGSSKVLDKVTNPLGTAFQALTDPISLLADGVESLADVVVTAKEAFASLIQKGINPAATLSGMTQPFESQVRAFNPGTSERYDLALQNLSAAAGKMFQPIIESARTFADDLNRLYTAIAEPVSNLFGTISSSVKEFNTEFSVGFVRLVKDAAQFLQPFAEQLRPLASFMGGVLRDAMVKTADLFKELGSMFGPTMSQAVETTIVAIRSLSTSLMGLGNVVASQTRLLAVGVANSPAGQVAGFEMNRWNNMIEFNNRWSLMGMLGGGGNTSSQIEGPMTFAAQQARQIGMEEIGQQARASAFSQAGSLQQQMADAATESRDVLQQILTAIQGWGLGDMATSLTNQAATNVQNWFA